MNKYVVTETTGLLVCMAMGWSIPAAICGLMLVLDATHFIYLKWQRYRRLQFSKQLRGRVGDVGPDEAEYPDDDDTDSGDQALTLDRGN